MHTKCELSLLERDQGEVQQLTSEQRDTFLRAHRICLVDDVVISGARVFGYRWAINSTRRDPQAGECDLYCLVGVARAISEKHLMSISDVLHHSPNNPRFLSVESMYLPNWDEANCRWCAELRILNELPRTIKEHPLIKNRVAALSQPSGFVDDLFLPWAGGTMDEYWKLNPGSVFGHVQGADLAASVAAAIQSMRGERREDGEWQESYLDEDFCSPLAKILDPIFYVAGRYYEPAIIASILRASKNHDIRAPGRHEAELSSRVKALVSEEMSKDLHGELMLAAALHQLPRAYDDALPQAHPDMVALVKAIFTV